MKTWRYTENFRLEKCLQKISSLTLTQTLNLTQRRICWGAIFHGVILRRQFSGHELGTVLRFEDFLFFPKDMLILLGLKWNSQTNALSALNILAPPFLPYLEMPCNHCLQLLGLLDCEKKLFLYLTGYHFQLCNAHFEILGTQKFPLPHGVNFAERDMIS